MSKSRKQRCILCDALKLLKCHSQGTSKPLMETHLRNTESKFLIHKNGNTYMRRPVVFTCRKRHKPPHYAIAPPSFPAGNLTTLLLCA